MEKAKADKMKYIVFSIFDFAFNYVGTATVIIYKYITMESREIKISVTGIFLLIALLLTAVKVFEVTYRRKHDTLLQQLAEATSETEKIAISNVLNKHKMMSDVIQHITIILPFLVVFIISSLGEEILCELKMTVLLILSSLCAGSIFNVIKKPVGEKLKLNKIISK